MERKFEAEQGCGFCGEIVEVRNGYMVKHTGAAPAACLGSRTIGVTLDKAERRLAANR